MMGGKHGGIIGSVASRALGTTWVMVLAFLVLALPARAALGSEPAEFWMRTGGAALAGAMFLLWRAQKRSARAVAADPVADRRVSLA